MTTTRTKSTGRAGRSEPVGGVCGRSVPRALGRGVHRPVGFRGGTAARRRVGTGIVSLEKRPGGDLRDLLSLEESWVPLHALIALWASPHPAGASRSTGARAGLSSRGGRGAAGRDAAPGGRLANPGCRGGADAICETDGLRARGPSRVVRRWAPRSSGRRIGSCRSFVRGTRRAWTNPSRGDRIVGAPSLPLAPRARSETSLSPESRRSSSSVSIRSITGTRVVAALKSDRYRGSRSHDERVPQPADTVPPIGVSRSPPRDGNGRPPRKLRRFEPRCARGRRHDSKLRPGGARGHGGRSVEAFRSTPRDAGGHRASGIGHRDESEFSLPFA